MKWRQASRGLFYDANEGSVVYYDRSSGDTHLLSEFAAFVLQQFDTEPLELPDLIQAAKAAGDDAAGLEDALRSVLDELTALHILQAA